MVCAYLSCHWRSMMLESYDRFWDLGIDVARDAGKAARDFSSEIKKLEEIG